MDEKYSTAMVKAVERFEKAHGLEQDGEWGAKCNKVYDRLISK